MLQYHFFLIFLFLHYLLKEMIYLYLFLEFFKVGLFTFGGGYAMIPLIKEVVLSRGWMDEAHFIDMIGLSEVTPGPIAINMATFIGSEQGGILGSTVATIGVILPAFIIMLLISILLKKFMMLLMKLIIIQIQCLFLMILNRK